MKKTLLALLSVICLLAACKRTVTPSAKYMVLDEISYLRGFPLSFKAENAVPVISDVIGARRFRIIDSLLIIDTSDPAGFWHIFSLPDEKPIGRFIGKGRGPAELIGSPSINQASFRKKDGKLYAVVLDWERKKMIEIDMTDMMENGSTEISTLPASLPLYAVNSILLDDNTLFCRELSEDLTKNTRYIFKDGEKVIPDNLEKLNRAQVHPGQDHNILAADIQYNKEKGLVLECPIYLNHINIYSPEGAFGKTITLAPKIDNIEAIQNRAPADRIYTYNTARMFSDFFGVIYFNETVLDSETERKVLPRIQFFDWNGEPLMELEVDRFFTFFDIDFTNGFLYIFDQPVEELYKYDIADVLSQIM